MEIIRGLDFCLRNSSVSLGKFDGVHKGHRYLLSNIKAKKGLVSTAFTFEMGRASKIYVQEEKDAILKSLGIAREIIFPFQRETKNMTAQEFIEQILIGKMDARYICVGEDFRFGKDRSGDITTLAQYQKKYGYHLQTVKKLTYEEEIISSTKIRELLSQGNMTLVNEYLGAPYFVEGVVRHGEEMGRRLDFPTVNLAVEEIKLLPLFGVYATVVEIGEKKYYGVTNVGVKPTAGEFEKGVETHILDFHEDIYGKKIRIYFYHFLREEKKFASFDALKEQISADIKAALQFTRMCEQ